MQERNHTSVNKVNDNLWKSQVVQQCSLQENWKLFSEGEFIPVEKLVIRYIGYALDHDGDCYWMSTTQMYYPLKTQYPEIQMLLYIINWILDEQTWEIDGDMVASFATQTKPQ